MTNGDKFIFEGKTENLGNVYSNNSHSKPIEDYFKSKSILNYINKAKKSDDIIELKDVLITKVQK